MSQKRDSSKVTIKHKKHIIFTYKGNVYQSYKEWSIDRIERVLNRIGSEFWDIGF